jgi:hypothetical protein
LLPANVPKVIYRLLADVCIGAVLGEGYEVGDLGGLAVVVLHEQLLLEVGWQKDKKKSPLI